MFVVSAVAMALYEGVRHLLWPTTPHPRWDLPSILIAGGMAAAVAAWALRRQRALQQRMHEATAERARLAELQARLLERTGELERANESLRGEAAERHRVEKQLRESEERYALAARGANDGLWDWNLTSDEVFFSDRWKEMVGAAGRPMSSSPEEWFSRVHLSDIPQLKVDIAAQAAGTRSHFESEHRLRHADGYFIWVLCRGVVVRDADGRAARIAGSMTDITARKDLEERLRREAQFDALTGLPNRSYANDLLRRVIARSRRNKDVQFAVLFLDCDRFKVVNDSLGHHAGDALLRMVAGRLNACVRPGDVVARLGGDEFILILDGVRDEAEAVGVAERIQQALTQPFYLDGRELFTSASVGIAMNGRGAERPEDYVRDADLAMYRAKMHGRARHEVFRPEFRTGAVLQLSLESDLRRALDRQELRMLYQPIWSLTTGRIQGFEALLRWVHPEHGPMQPADFIPIAEETGLILPLGEWVMRDAAGRVASWNKGAALGDPVWVSVNVAARQLTHSGLVTTVSSVLEEAQIEPKYLKLEITESMIMSDATAAVGALEQLKGLGVPLLMDDFGTGHASLSYLHRLPISTIKIDRYFVGRIDSNSECLEIVRTILDLSRSLRMDVVAEGVETAAQRDLLISLGCEFVQGYLLAPPLEVDAAEQMLKQNRQQLNRG